MLINDKLLVIKRPHTTQGRLNPIREAGLINNLNASMIGGEMNIKYLNNGLNVIGIEENQVVMKRDEFLTKVNKN